MNILNYIPSLLKMSWKGKQSLVITLYCVCVCVCVHVHSDSEMEIEAEHYTNGVVEGSSARIMNGTYKHEEILQPDDNSIGNGVTGTCAHTHGPHLLLLHFMCLLPVRSFYIQLDIHTCVYLNCVCFCCQQMTAVVMADSFAEGTRRPQRGWSSLGGSCRRSMNSCAASMARTPHIRRCYRYAHATARAHTLDSNRQLLLHQIKVMPKLGWRDFFCWHHLKSWLQHSVHAGVWFRMCCNNADSLCCLTTGGFSSAHEKAQMTLYRKLCPLIHKQPLWEQKSLWKNNRNLMGMITV